MKGNKNKVLIYSLLMVPYIIILGLCLVKQEKVEIALQSDKYVGQSYSISDVVETNDCLVRGNKEIEISGADPYLVLEIQETEVGSVSLQGLKKYQGDYKIYYALEQGFSEDKVATRVKNKTPIFVIGEDVDTIRIDFERAMIGKIYSFQNDFEVQVNSYMEQIRTDVFEAFVVWGIYILASAVYMLYLYWKSGFVQTGIVWIYNVAVGYVWIQYVSRHTNIFVCLAMLLVAFLGMFFWGNHKINEEKKCVKE